jgi:hypothetical protein
MAFPVFVNDVILVRHICYTPSQIAVRAYRAGIVALVGIIDSTALLACLDNSVAARYKAIMSPDARYRGTGIKKVVGAGTTSEEVISSNDGPGTVAGNLLPSQVTGMTTVQTGFAGRANRGRIYWPFPSEADDIAGAIPDPTYVVRADAAASILTGSPTLVFGAMVLTWTVLLHHRVPNTNTPTTGRLTRPKWATQRRRGQYGKTNVLPF